MALEDLLERIAVALEKSAALQEEHLNFVVRTQQTGTISQTLTDHPEVNSEPVEKVDHVHDHQKDLVDKATKNKTATTEVDAKAKTEKEKPKYDFNKEIRQPFVDLLNITKNRRGPKDATQLAKKLLKEFTGQTEEPLTIKTLTEVKYEEFLAAVKEQRSYVLDDERYAGFDKE